MPYRHHRRSDLSTFLRLSLRGRLHMLMWFTALAVSTATMVGLWKYDQFAHSKRLIEESSKTLLVELENTFQDSLHLAEIQSDLILFIQTAQPEVMVRIIEKANQLRDHLPEQTKHLATTFLNQAETLEIRMDSLRRNNNKVLSTGNTLVEALAQSFWCQNDPTCQEGVSRVSKIFRQIRTIYMSSIVNNKTQETAATQQQITMMLELAREELLFFSKKVTPEQSSHLLKFMNHFYEFEESIVTVAAIRDRVVTSEKEIINILHSLNSQLAQISITHNKQVLTQAETGLRLATGYVLLLFSALALVTLCCLVTFALMVRSILSPLDSLVDLLNKFTILLRGVRHLSNTEKIQYNELHETITKRPDEIGDVGRATQALLDHIHNISEFRRKIENDKNCLEVYHRLGKIFINELQITSFVIYETDDKGLMSAAYCHPPELKDEMPDFIGNDICRAKRTAALVHSFDDPDICPVCRINNVLDYFCLPLTAVGEIIGVIQILLPIATSTEQKNQSQRFLEEARSYIDEALPILQAKRYAGKLEEIATQDHLTGLYNRHYLEISLPRIEAGVKRRNSRLGVLLCDMDHFKKINDSHGHEAGDRALLELADILRSTVRSSDLIVRYGGEEFLILLVDIKEGEDLAVAEKVRQAVADHLFQLPDGARRQTISIGVAEFSDESLESVTKTLRLADIALYKAKEEGRNRVVKFNKE